MVATAVISATGRLASRSSTRTEADLQADVYLLLTAGSLSLDASQVARLEVQIGDGTRRRLDVEIGHCVIEVKKDLRPIGILHEAEEQLAGYVLTQTQRLRTRYVGLLTDGTTWTVYHLDDGVLVAVATLVLSEQAPDVDRLQVWLESILATQEVVLPSPLEVDRRLGAGSPAHLLDHATLAVLYGASSSEPEVKLKRDLWAKLLRTAFGKAFTDDANLFIDHTLLVLTAEIIAHAVVGFDISTTGALTPQALIRGTEFSGAVIYGVVEEDFFDWVLEATGGPEFIVELTRRIAQFDWSLVEHDVLKILYESIISADARASLGEYYTPDWLADQVVSATIPDPLAVRVLDPACGSGTFLFHAARAYLAGADAAGVPNGQAVSELTEHVFGMDIHPVAVTLARVTYLLAIGSARLTAPDRGSIAIPVYLGDAVQWEQRKDLFNAPEAVTISTAGSDLVEGGGALLGDDLVFPRSVLRDAGDFDRLVGAMANKAANTSMTPTDAALITPTLHQFGVHEADVGTLVQTFATLRRLRRTNRDHIWGYYVRNLIRPLWLSDPNHRVDVLVGNPPWLRYSKMTESMQARYKVLAQEGGLLSGGLGASSRDLSTLFVARSVELYLKLGGVFSFVMPYGILTRKPHEGFRSGHWSPLSDQVTAQFAESWDLSAVTTGFPMVSCVVHGKRAGLSGAMPSTVQKWSGKLNPPNVSWAVAQNRVTRSPGVVSVLGSIDTLPTSVYKKRFRNGAILYPRMLIFVDQQKAGPLGAGKGRVPVTSRRSEMEKKPWNAIKSLHAIVEAAFIRKVHLGETVLHYRVLDPLTAVLPLSWAGILTQAEIEEHPGLADWWQQAEKLWNGNKVANDPSTLVERLNFHKQLSAQIPTGRHRVVYTASGNRLAAARIEDPEVIIEHKLYWAAVSGVAEARFLTAILNSTLILERVKPLQALGLFGGRDFDKNVFSTAIPVFDDRNADHLRLVEFESEAEVIANAVALGSTQRFKRNRADIRTAINLSDVGEKIETLVARIVPAPPLPPKS